MQSRLRVAPGVNDAASGGLACGADRPAVEAWRRTRGAGWAFMRLAAGGESAW